MARFSNENNVSALNGASKEKNVDTRKDLIQKSAEDNTTLHNEEFMLIVEVAKCLVTETCLQASHHALSAVNNKNDRKECVSHHVLDFP